MVVQVVVLAEDLHIQALLAEQGVQVRSTYLFLHIYSISTYLFIYTSTAYLLIYTQVATVADISPVVVKPAAVLASLYTHLGRNSKLGLSGRSNPDIGILTTSKV